MVILTSFRELNEIFQAWALTSDFEFCATCGVVKLVKFLSGAAVMIGIPICSFIIPSQESVDRFCDQARTFCDLVFIFI